ncbi:MAG: metallophosphoesterase [Halobacteriaceae archaeon]
MRIGLVSDIHANKVAFDAVLDALPEDVDQLLCAGDVVGYNPWPAECVAMVRDREIPTVAGNHERMVLADRNFRGNGMAAAGVDHARAALDDAAMTWLASLPTDRRALDGRVRVVHGHPENPDRYTYPDQFRPELLGEERVLVMGHTHVQHAEQYEEEIVVNPGSVGQPRDEDPRAAYAILDLEEPSIDLRRVEYDIDAVAAAVEDADLPRRTADRLYQGR